MSKFLFFTDTHIKGINPSNRIGNYYQDIINKIKEVIKIAKNQNCEFIIHGGDVFDSNLVSLNMCDELVDMIEESKIIWYVIRGNHDCICHNPELSSNTTLDHMFRRSKYIKHLDRLSNDKTYFIYGWDYFHGIEEAINKSGMRCDFKGKKIAVVHAMIMEKPFLPSVAHCVIGKFKCDYDLVLVGHNHTQFGLIKHENTLFVGIGSLARLTVAKSDLDNKPSVAIIDTEGELKIIELKSAKPAKDVFDLENIKEDIIFDDKVDNFIRSLEDTKFQSLSLVGMVQEIIKQNNCEDEVKEELIKRISIAEGCREI